MSILLFITIFLLAINLWTLIVPTPQNHNWAKMAAAVHDMSPEHKDEVHECGLPVTMVSGLAIISVISTFIKLVMVVVLTVNFPTPITIISGTLLISTVLIQRLRFQKEVDFFMLSRGKQTKLVIAEGVTAILFYGSVFATMLSEIF